MLHIIIYIDKFFLKTKDLYNHEDAVESGGTSCTLILRTTNHLATLLTDPRRYIRQDITCRLQDIFIIHHPRQTSCFGHVLFQDLIVNVDARARVVKLR